MESFSVVAGKFLYSSIYHPGCIRTLEIQAEAVQRFLHRIDERGEDPKEVVLNFVNVDDSTGRHLVNFLMPGHEDLWQSFRDKGETPFARGIADREGYQELLDFISPEAGKKLRNIPGKAIIVVNHNVIEVFDYTGF